MKNIKISYKDFILLLKKKKVIVFGEIHGTIEIPNIIKNIIKKSINYIDIVFIEIPKNQQIYIDNYINSKNNAKLYEIPFFNKEIRDGRSSKEMLLLIKEIKDLRKINSKLKIICVDTNSFINRDYLIYKEIKKYILKENNCLFITGNVHASKKKIIIDNKTITPCIYYLNKFLKNKLISINFVPNSGSFYNLKIQKIVNKERKLGIYKSKLPNYDFDYVLKKITPCTFL